MILSFFLYMVSENLQFNFFPFIIQFSQQYLLKRLSSPLYILTTFVMDFSILSKLCCSLKRQLWICFADAWWFSLVLVQIYVNLLAGVLASSRWYIAWDFLSYFCCILYIKALVLPHVIFCFSITSLAFEFLYLFSHLEIFLSYLSHDWKCKTLYTVME